MVPQRVFPPFLRGEKWGRAAARNVLVRFPSRPQAENASTSADSPLVSANRSAVPSPPAGPFLCSAQRKGRKKCARGNLYRGGFPGTPSPTPKGLRPLGTPVGFTGDEGRETRDCLQVQDRTTAYKCLREDGAYRPSSAPVCALGHLPCRRRAGEWPVSGFQPNTGRILPAPPLRIEPASLGFDSVQSPVPPRQVWLP